MTARHIAIHCPPGPGPDLLAQVFFLGPNGEFDGTPLESRQIRPGVTAQFPLRPDRVVVIQAAPGFGPAGPEFSDGEC